MYIQDQAAGGRLIGAQELLGGPKRGHAEPHRQDQASESPAYGIIIIDDYNRLVGSGHCSSPTTAAHTLRHDDERWLLAFRPTLSVVYIGDVRRGKRAVPFSSFCDMR